MKNQNVQSNLLLSNRITGLIRGTKTLLHLAIIFLVLSPGIVSAQDKDEEAIKSVIKKVMDANQNRQADAWQKLWMHDEKVSRTWFYNSDRNRISGWEKFNSETMKFFKENPKPSPMLFTLDSFNIRSDGKMALAEYRVNNTITENGVTVQRPSYLSTLLVKNNDQWKIASSTSHMIADADMSPQSLENNLNELGYKYINAKKINEAIEIFQLNVKLWPQAWNSYDSLGEAYALAGNKDLAIQNYQKSMELNPKNENGIAALKKLKGE